MRVLPGDLRWWIGLANTGPAVRASDTAAEALLTVIGDQPLHSIEQRLGNADRRDREPFEAAVAEVAAVTAWLLGELPERRQPPSTVPSLRRPEARARTAAARPADP